LAPFPTFQVIEPAFEAGAAEPRVAVGDRDPEAEIECVLTSAIPPASTAPELPAPAMLDCFDSDKIIPSTVE
jgi:hypothetical protein